MYILLYCTSVLQMLELLLCSGEQKAHMQNKVSTQKYSMESFLSFWDFFVCF